MPWHKLIILELEQRFFVVCNRHLTQWTAPNYFGHLLTLSTRNAFIQKFMSSILLIYLRFRWRVSILIKRKKKNFVQAYVLSTLTSPAEKPTRVRLTFYRTDWESFWNFSIQTMKNIKFVLNGKDVVGGNFNGFLMMVQCKWDADKSALNSGLLKTFYVSRSHSHK